MGLGRRQQRLQRNQIVGRNSSAVGCIASGVNHLDGDGHDRAAGAAVELHSKAGRTPFDVNSVYLKTGKRFPVVLDTGRICT
jgi:hypothetical protein